MNGFQGISGRKGPAGSKGKKGESAIFNPDLKILPGEDVMLINDYRLASFFAVIFNYYSDLKFYYFENYHFENYHFDRISINLQLTFS